VSPLLQLALVLIVAGLIMAWLSVNVRQPLLAQITYWSGIVLLVLGLLLLLLPVLIWIAQQLRNALGV